jgi:redox-sensitive bicupin YhaK (pirin superfamily)
MTKDRHVQRVIKSRPTLEGAGVHLRRVFGNNHVPLFDPFLLLDDFRSDVPEEYVKGFPWHPHRGIETITYMLHGEVEHGDSLGNSGVISSGDTQWMTAGSGIIHQEMPKGDREGRMGGFQLWANLPGADKMMEPRYRDVKSAQVPEVTLANGARVRIICGAIDGHVGPVQDVVTDPTYLDVSLPAGSELVRETPRGHTVFAYVIEGQALFCDAQDPFGYDVEGASYFDMQRDASVHDGTLALFGDGDRLRVRTGATAARFLLISGKPIGEPVAWYGPIVMNTEDELRLAFEELERGTFIKHGRK